MSGVQIVKIESISAMHERYVDHSLDDVLVQMHMQTGSDSGLCFVCIRSSELGMMEELYN